MSAARRRKASAPPARRPVAPKPLPEPRFLKAGDVDRLAALVFELAAQLHVERHRRMALEQVLRGQGVLAPDALDALASDETFLSAARAEADRSLCKLLRLLSEDGDRRAPLRAEAP
jgi:hypothetical protein